MFSRPRDLGLAVVGVAGTPLLAFMLVAIWRRRGRLATPATERRVPASTPSPRARSTLDAAERLALVRAVAQLDEQFEAGNLDEVTYRAQRTEQKARLLALTRSSASAS